MTGFKNFILRGSLVELAVAFIMATAFAAVVTATVGLIMDLIGKEELPVEKIFAGMKKYAPRQVQDWLDELETLGFIELRIEEGGSRRERTARHKVA